MKRTLLVPALLAVATPVAAQYAQPWNGGGITVSAEEQAARAGRVIPLAVAGVALTVSDIDRSRRFYEELLTFRTIGDTTIGGEEWDKLTGIAAGRIRVVTLALGSERVELWQYLDHPGRPAPAMQSNDRWFQHVAIIVRNMDSAAARLERAGVARVSPAPQTLPPSIPAAAGIRAYYFRDPDGHPLEILMFPPDKGAARWHADGPDLFLGIDHSAVVVWDTERSLDFYRGLLGLEVRGSSMNFGPEQERLNNVAGARLRITGLRTGNGPGIEFLDYRAPRTGRPYPSDAQPNDLLHWHTRIVVNDVALAVRRAQDAGGRLVSKGAISLDPAGNGFRRAALVRDPDGHAIALFER
jgi:catechol 2,3-dioxygenase-like lactoylglutathione lyase family enzyme